MGQQIAFTVRVNMYKYMYTFCLLVHNMFTNNNTLCTCTLAAYDCVLACN